MRQQGGGWGNLISRVTTFRHLTTPPSSTTSSHSTGSGSHRANLAIHMRVGSRAASIWRNSAMERTSTGVMNTASNSLPGVGALGASEEVDSMEVLGNMFQESKANLPCSLAILAFTVCTTSTRRLSTIFA